MKKLLLLSIPLILIGAGRATSSSFEPIDSNISKQIVTVRYREDPVNIGHKRFESLNTSRSSFTGGA